MFKHGILVANYGVVMEAAKRMENTEQLQKIEKAPKKKAGVEKVSDDALTHFGIWVAAGMKVDSVTGYPKLGKVASVAIVKVLLPVIDPNEKAKDYNTMKACEKWLGSLAGGTTWVDEMKSYEAKVQELAPVTATLF